MWKGWKYFEDAPVMAKGWVERRQSNMERLGDMDAPGRGLPTKLLWS